MPTTVQAPTNIRPFQIDIPDEKLADLRCRLAATRWPSAGLVTDSSQGVQSKMLQKLARYWENEHDWRKVENKLNASMASLLAPCGNDAALVVARDLDARSRACSRLPRGEWPPPVRAWRLQHVPFGTGTCPRRHINN